VGPFPKYGAYTHRGRFERRWCWSNSSSAIQTFEPRGWVRPPDREDDPAAVGVGTEARHPLRYTPRRPAIASSPLGRSCWCVRPHASVIASNRSRKGNSVLCPPGTCAFLGAFLRAGVRNAKVPRALKLCVLAGPRAGHHAFTWTRSLGTRPRLRRIARSLILIRQSLEERVTISSSRVPVVGADVFG
jgi:hypothetical protein